MFEISRRTINLIFEKYTRVYAYGAGYYGKKFAEYARWMKLPLTGFLVTESINNNETCCGFPVYQFRTTDDYTDCCIILTMKSEFQNEVMTSLNSTRAYVLTLADDFLNYADMIPYNCREERKLITKCDLVKKTDLIRVAIFAHDAALLGANRSLLDNIVVWQRENKIQIILIAPRFGELQKKLKKLRVSNFVFPYSWWVEGHGTPAAIDSNESIYEIVKMLKKYDIDAVYSNTSVIDIGARVACLMKIPHVWHIREFVVEDFHQKFVMGRRSSLEFMAESSKAIICISSVLLAKYRSILNNKKLFHLIPNGVNLIKYKKRKIIEFCQDKLNVVMCGSVAEHKNQLELIKAIAELPETFQNKLDVHFYGPEDTVYGKKVRNAIINLGLEDICHLHGYNNNIEAILPKANIGVMASRMETFGRVTVEYMLAGLYVIASDRGANPELLQDGLYGMLYKYGQPSDLASCLEHCIANRNEIYTVSARAQADSFTRYNPINTAHKIQKILYDVIH